MSAKKILVIDDEELLIKSLSRLLEKQGYEVYTVRNGSDAVAVMDEDDFDLVISDIRMPGLSGVETVRQIQENMSKKQKKIPTIFVTGFADDNIEREARKLNPIAYIMKPFDIRELLKTVMDCLGV